MSKKIVSGIMFELLIVSWLMLTFSTVTEEAHSSTTPRMYLDPSNNIYTTETAYLGMKFNVTIWCSNVLTDVGGANIYVEFNDSIINVTQWWAPDWDPEFFMPTPYAALPTPPNPGYIHVEEGRGYVKVAVSKGGLPPQPPWGHDGKIAIFEFNITAVPESGKFTSSLLIDTVDTYLLDDWASEVPGVSKENGYYEFKHVSRIYLDPSNNIYTTETAYLGMKFNVTIWCSNVAADIALAQINLVFNDNLINVTRWWPPDWDSEFFMPPPIQVLPTTQPDPVYYHVSPGVGYVLVAVMKDAPQSAPWGHDGKIAIFEFNITAAPPEGGQLTSSLNINTTDTHLLDPEVIVIPGVVKEDGYYEFAVVLVGDVNGDGSVDLKDVFAVALAYGSFPGHPRWNPNADINGDGTIDLKDYYTVCINYGETYP